LFFLHLAIAYLDRQFLHIVLTSLWFPITSVFDLIFWFVSISEISHIILHYLFHWFCSIVFIFLFEFIRIYFDHTGKLFSHLRRSLILRSNCLTRQSIFLIIFLIITKFKLPFSAFVWRFLFFMPKINRFQIFLLRLYIAFKQSGQDCLQWHLI
jgi:hypothetical protein